ncbi:MAG: hypothetical protein ABJC04_08820 [Verrucomicrobiota bacterium]
MKLCQAQTWKMGESYLRITRLERLAVEYKTMSDLVSRQGTSQRVSKKEFCRLIKNAILLNPKEVAAARDINPEQLSAKEIEASDSILPGADISPPHD